MPEINLAELVRESGNRRKRIVLPPVYATLAEEQDLYRRYLAVADVWEKGAKKIIAAYDPDGLTTDADGAQIQFLIDQIARQADNTILYQTRTLGRWVSRVGTRNFRGTISAAKSATGVSIEPFIRLRDAQPFLEQSIRQNVAYLKNLSQDAQRRIEQNIYDGLANRWTKKRLTDEIAKSAGITKRRARNIATDQTHKLNAALNQFRNEQLGITHYRWQTVEDERVRPLHASRNKKIFAWGQQLSDGPPGVPINCRCRSEAVLDLEE